MRVYVAAAPSSSGAPGVFHMGFTLDVSSAARPLVRDNEP